MIFNDNMTVKEATLLYFSESAGKTDAEKKKLQEELYTVIKPISKRELSGPPCMGGY